MLKRLFACALIFATIIPTSAAMADDVEMSEAQRAANKKAYARQKALGLADAPRGRGAQKAQKQQARKGQQVPGNGQKCAEAARNAEATATGTAVLSSVIGLIPFGGSASGIAGAAAGAGAAVVGEAARQKSARAMQDCM
ncbi:hypothetical protein [Mesorhizobium shangrilense]|uniref:Glycine zipper family protein n=1 Tax=Mesorhizobium shangrilense TaxID=460060 RepID=A0ABV2D6C0_9HYPH